MVWPGYNVTWDGMDACMNVVLVTQKGLGLNLVEQTQRPVTRQRLQEENRDGELDTTLSWKIWRNLWGFQGRNAARDVNDRMAIAC